ncbi:methyltransferase [Amycolatopsis benzoatilytica]|uniref:methyltransferase n=1 Tax=Amycolatopsis benzoatilytica TaxID=346045 RepID=UPI00035D9B04|nr:methyltransferase [Amycolatopsis benzoatilytica]
MTADDVRRLLQAASLATPMALRVAVTLGLPDRLCAPATVDEVAAELDLSPIALGVLCGHLGTLGVVERIDDRYRTTEYGKNLCVEAENGLANLLDLNRAAGRAELAFVELEHSIRTGEAAYARRYGRDFWADLTEHPVLRKAFDQQMTDRFRTEIPEVVSGIDWSRFATLVDVGGGRGDLLAAVLEANPKLRAQLIDLEATAAQAKAAFQARRIADRVEVRGGSFFDPLPAGADGYLLVDILHNWDDEHARRILARCAEAAGRAGRILAIEAVSGIHARTEMDLVMLAHFGGRERRVEEFRTLASEAGLILTDATALTSQRGLLEFRAG